jgi:type VI secretion system protein ImpE
VARTAFELYQGGELDAAIEALAAELRDSPGDLDRRTFLFGLLCFAGAYDRAERQLDVLERLGDPGAAVGVKLYRDTLSAERQRQNSFRDASPSEARNGVPADLSGVLNGRTFSTVGDADPRVGAALEFFAGARYCSIPFHQVISLRAAPPVELCDLVWLPADLQVMSEGEVVALGSVLLPVLTPLTWEHDSGQVRLGRETHWHDLPSGASIPLGQKLLVADDEELPILELRELSLAPSLAG